ncbi:MAG: Por secretion system protein [Bacteroidaceae bacterium]|nr:Por secretion system protein [Bacteroidaceae bacterium]
MVKKSLIIFLFVLVSVLGVKASDDNWTLYPSYHNTTYCQVVGDKVYVLASGALYSYTKSDNEVRKFDKITVLSDIDISYIRYSHFIDALVVVYENANIDILYNDESVYNISDFKNKSMPDKTINGVDIQDKYVYLSTSFGVVVLDLENLEFENTYNTGLDTYCAYRFDGKFYTGTKSGFYCCDMTKNLLDKNNWEQLYPNYPVTALCELGGVLYCIIDFVGIYTFTPNPKGLKLVIANNGEKYKAMYRSGDEIIAYAPNKVSVITDEKTVVTYTNNGSSYIAKSGNTFWDCKGYNGLVECEFVDNGVVEVAMPIVPNSPVRNYCEFMKFTNTGKLLVAGGRINYLGLPEYNHDGTLMEYNFENDRWNNFDISSMESVTGLKYTNMCSIDEDPTEPGRYFASSFGYGVCEFKDGEFVQHYDYENSALESAIANNKKYVRVSSVCFDNDGNLWCTNTTNIVDVIKVLKKSGEWVSLNYKDIEGFETITKLYIDSRGWLWVVSMQGEPGLFCAKMNNTPFDTSDDITKTWLHKFVNQDGVSYDIYQIYDIAEDRSGAIWVGTNIGVFVIDDPEKFFNDGVFKQIKVARNDGTGLADYFMSGVYIKDIEIDGAGRKWIGTNNNGIYLVSADGQETIHHFTTDNSPLPSDCIESIAINNVSGDVFIGTDKGIASYKGDATVAAESLEKGNVYAFPNPVTADYSGNISVVGLTQGCVVKIVDAAGYLINEGESNGGMYSWNGRNQRGEKVASGVYYVLAYDSEGREGVAAKILITR